MQRKILTPWQMEVSLKLDFIVSVCVCPFMFVFLVRCCHGAIWGLRRFTTQKGLVLIDLVFHNRHSLLTIFHGVCYVQKCCQDQRSCISITCVLETWGRLGLGVRLSDTQTLYASLSLTPYLYITRLTFRHLFLIQV